MTTKERVLSLINNSGKDDKTIIKEAGFKSASTITDWRKKPSSISADAVAKLARYFNVTTDYLLGLTDESSRAELPAIMEKYAALSLAGKEVADGVIDKLYDSEQGQATEENETYVKKSQKA